jgi:hypothetical protein
MNDWLDAIEVRVREAAATARKARTENAALRRRIAELERRLQDSGGDERSAVWSAEREEVRQRLEGLVAHLESLIENSTEDS